MQKNMVESFGSEQRDNITTAVRHLYVAQGRKPVEDDVIFLAGEIIKSGYPYQAIIDGIMGYYDTEMRAISLPAILKAISEALHRDDKPVDTGGHDDDWSYVRSVIDTCKRKWGADWWRHMADELSANPPPLIEDDGCPHCGRGGTVSMYSHGNSFAFACKCERGSSPACAKLPRWTGEMSQSVNGRVYKYIWANNYSKIFKNNSPSVKQNNFTEF